MGARIISCDHLGHAAYKRDTKCYQEMVEYFGEGILNEDKDIDRKKLGPIVFSNKVKYKYIRLYCTELNFALNFVIFSGSFGKTERDGLAGNSPFIHGRNRYA